MRLGHIRADEQKHARVEVLCLAIRHCGGAEHLEHRSITGGMVLPPGNIHVWGVHHVARELTKHERVLVRDRRCGNCGELARTVASQLTRDKRECFLPGRFTEAIAVA